MESSRLIIVGEIAIDHGRRKRRHRARATDNRHTALTGRAVETFDPGDKLTTVGEVDVVTARLDSRLRNSVFLRLEGTRGVDQRIDAELAEPRSQSRVVGVDHNRPFRGKAQSGGQGRGLAGVASSDQQAHGR